jgi:hypothetical protein
MAYCLDDTKGQLIGCPLLFICGATRVKNIIFLSSKGPPIRSSLLFVRGVMRVKSINFY